MRLVVPLHDCTSSSDIDWTRPIAKIDEQLCDKYDLASAEISFTESNVKVMVRE